MSEERVPERGPGALQLSGFRRERPDRRAVGAALVLHLAAIGMLWATARALSPDEPQYVVYRVNIVSPPPQEQGEPAVTTPEPPAPVVPPAPEPEPQPPEPQPQPQPQPPKPRPEPAKVEPKKQPPAKPAPQPPQVTRGGKPDPKSAGGEGLNVQLSGEECPTPDYCANIIRQINRFFRWSGTGSPRVEVGFVILRDGSARDIRIVRASGNLEFDFKAMEAIEQAGNRRAFGALPRAFPGEFLPVSFYFEPPR